MRSAFGVEHPEYVSKAFKIPFRGSAPRHAAPAPAHGRHARPTPPAHGAQGRHQKPGFFTKLKNAVPKRSPAKPPMTSGTGVPPVVPPTVPTVPPVAAPVAPGVASTPSSGKGLGMLAGIAGGSALAGGAAGAAGGYYGAKRKK